MSKKIEAQIEEVVIEPDKIPPIIVNFQNGQLKDENAAKKMECGVYKQGKKMVLAISSGSMVYKGITPEEKDEDQGMVTMLAVLNKRTGKMRLVKAERLDVVPVLDQQNKLPSSQILSNVIDKHNAIDKEFGSKAKKRKIQLTEKMAIDVDSMKKDLNTTAHDTNSDTAPSTAVPQDMSSVMFLPTCNRDADHKSDVYNVYEIVPKEVLKTLYDAALEHIESGFSEGNRFFSSVLNELQISSKAKKKTAILLYIKALSTWTGMLVKDATKTNPALVSNCFGSSVVAETIINKYCVQTPTGRQRPNDMKTKAMVHCIILALSVNNFSLDLEMFASIFKAVSVKRLVELAKLVGARAEKNKKNVYALRIPLPPPISLLKRKRK